MAPARRSSARTASAPSAPRKQAGAASSLPLWAAADPSKRWAEAFFLTYSPFWMVWALCIVVPFKLYEVRVREREKGREGRGGRWDDRFPPSTTATNLSPPFPHLPPHAQRCNEWGYMAIGVAMAAPCVAVPLLFPGAADAGTSLASRYWVKATVWVAIFSHIGNYFWTHYFYRLLGASYTFKAHRLNDVPVCLYLMTHAYFVFYHALANVAIRCARRSVARRGGGALAQGVATAAVVVSLAYATAYGETATIAHFPHYVFKVR